MKHEMPAELNVPAELIELFNRAKRLFPANEECSHGDANSQIAQLKRDVKIWQIALQEVRNELQVREQELRTTNQLMETFQAITHVGIVEMDASTRELRWSMETYRIHN